MSVGKLGVLLVVFAILIIGGIAASDAALSGAGPQEPIENEDFTPVGNETIALEFSNIEHAEYNRVVEVRDNNDEIVPEGDNYTWHASNGTISVEDGSQLAQEPNAFIDYSFTQPLDEAVGLANLFTDVLELQHYLLFVIAIAMVFGSLRALGGG